jgi:hypothetical protein
VWQHDFLGLGMETGDQPSKQQRRCSRTKQLTKAVPVARVLASKASATLPADNSWAMIPEPTTVASSRAVPKASAVARLARDIERMTLAYCGAPTCLTTSRRKKRNLKSRKRSHASSCLRDGRAWCQHEETACGTITPCSRPKLSSIAICGSAYEVASPCCPRNFERLLSCSLCEGVWRLLSNVVSSGRTFAIGMSPDTNPSHVCCEALIGAPEDKRPTAGCLCPHVLSDRALLCRCGRVPFESQAFQGCREHLFDAVAMLDITTGGSENDSDAQRQKCAGAYDLKLLPHLTYPGCGAEGHTSEPRFLFHASMPRAWGGRSHWIDAVVSEPDGRTNAMSVIVPGSPKNSA